MPALWLSSLLGCAPDAPVAQALDARDVARQTEVRVLAETAGRALAEGRALDAARSVVLGRSLDPAPFAATWDALAASEDPAVLRLLAGARGLDPAAAAELRARAERAEVAARYAGGGAERWAGVDLARGRAVLEGVLAEYLEKPDAARMRDAVQARYALLAGRFPTWTRPAVGETAWAVIEDAVKGGLPEGVAVGEGVEAALGALDPYTRAVWPDEIRGWQEHHAGVQTGIGVQLTDAPGGGAVVELPRVGGPAWVGGVHAGDRLVAVDERQVATAAEAEAALGGEAGTPVRLAVDRAGEALVFTLTRQEVPEETARGWARTAQGWDARVDDDVSYVRVSAFRPDTDDAFDAVVGEEAPKSIVVDLRGNGGGDVMAAVNLVDRFVATGTLADLVGRTLPRPQPGPNGELPWNASVPGHALEGVPVVVLVDGRTASAAEIVAGALRERAKAVLVGDTTYGKGLSQALRVDEKLGVGWQVTNSVWTLPSGRTFEAAGGVHTGLSPDLTIALTPGEQLQVDAMTRKRELPKAHPDGTPVPDLGTVARSDLVPLTEDPQLREALRIARDLVK